MYDMVDSLLLWKLGCLQRELPVSMRDCVGRGWGTEKKKSLELENEVVPSIFFKEPYLTNTDANWFFIASQKYFNYLLKTV